MFEKYPKIKNIHNAKTVKRVIDQFPELYTDTVWIAQEKIDGSNLQLEEENYRLVPYKRSGLAGEDFYDVGSVLHRDYDVLIKTINAFRDAYNTNDVILCGELFGDGVQKRIQYIEGKHFRYYDVKIDGSFIEYSDILFTINNLSSYCQGLFVPALKVTTLENLISLTEQGYFENLPSIYGREDSQISEGVVIKPVAVYYDKGTGDRISFKIKRSDFDDKGGKSKAKNSREFSHEAISLNMKCQEYVNKNRLLDLFSKHGEIESEKQIGQYIKLFMEDLLEDFESDYKDDLFYMDKKEQKFVKNVQKEVVRLLREYV